MHPRPVLLILLTTIACAGCAGRHAAPPAASGFQAAPSGAIPTGFALPSPASLAQAISSDQRRASYTSDDLRLEAEAFETALPNQRVSATASGLLLQPDWPKTVPSPFSGLAFAIYHLQAAGYSGDPSLNFGWVSAPGIPGNLYYGLANWEENRWDWWQGEADDKLDLGGTAPYFDSPGGDMLIAVLKIGTGTCELDYLRLGSLPPKRDLSATPAAGLVPLTVQFDASGSIDMDGSIVEYRWDPDGDGLFDQTSGDDPLFSHEYDTAGSYSAGLRLIDNDGIFSDIQVGIEVFDSLTFSFGSAGFRDYPGAILPDAGGNVIVLGRRESMEAMSDYDLFIAGLSLEQTALYYRSWGGAADERIGAACLGPDGFIYAAGSTTSYGAGGTDALLQKWSIAGELFWSRTIGSADDDEDFTDLLVYNGNIYACGSYYLETISRGLAFIAKLDMDGNLVWQHTVIGPGHSSYQGIAIRLPQALDPPSLELCGNYDPSSTDTDALYASYDLDGNMLACKIWGSAAERQYVSGICVSGSASPRTTVAGREYSSQYISFTGRPGGTVYLLSSPDGLETPAVALQAGGSTALSLLMKGQNYDDDSQYFVLARLDQDLGLAGWYAMATEGQGYCVPTAISHYSGAHLAVGGYQDGPVPVPLAFSLERSSSAEAWEDITPSQGTPSQLVVAGTPITTTDISGGVFNREGQNDFDSLIHLTPSS